MNRNIIREEPAEAEAVIQKLSEQVAQLEQNNTLLEQALQHNFRIFDALLRNGEQGITLTGPDRRIVRVIKGLTGIEPTMLCGVLIESLAVPEDRQSIVDAYDELLHGLCGKLTIAVRVPRADGTIFLHRATLTDMLDDPNVQGIVWNILGIRRPNRSSPFFLRRRTHCEWLRGKASRQHRFLLL